MPFKFFERLFDEELMIGMDLEDNFLVEAEGDETRKMFLILAPHFC